MIEINKEKCIKCLCCVKACPLTVIENNNGEPKVTDKFCLKCMHCGAVCQSEAITFDGKSTVLEVATMNLENEQKINLKELILKRRAYRHFTDEPVDVDIIKEALNLAAFAPSAKNQHPTKWIVVNNKNLIDKIMEIILENLNISHQSDEVLNEFNSGNNIVIGEASTIIFAYARNNAVDPATDTAIAVTTVELILQSYGLGTFWGGYLKSFMNLMPELKSIFSLPPNNSFYGALLVGHQRDEKYVNIPERLKRAEIRINE